jgi:hypothetical protein
MGARDLLDDLAEAGISVAAEGETLVIRPASRLTHEMRAALRHAKPELLALLSARRPYTLTKAEGDAAHAQPWDEAAIGRFVARVTLFLRRGINAADADDLAERLHLRDIQGDDRRLCFECVHIQAGRCANHRQAGLQAPEVGPDLINKLQRCPGFACAIAGAEA